MDLQRVTDPTGGGLIPMAIIITIALRQGPGPPDRRHRLGPQDQHPIHPEGKVWEAAILIMAFRKGVIAFGKTLRECENELQSTLEDWIFIGLKLGHPLPVLVG